MSLKKFSTNTLANRKESTYRSSSNKLSNSRFSFRGSRLPFPTQVEFLVVAGGGGGGNGDATQAGGGGGAGGLRTGTLTIKNTSTLYTITVGAGGANSTTYASGGAQDGGSGSNSSIANVSNTISTTGGGGGGRGEAGGNGLRGGSGGGGGAGASSQGTGGVGTPGQGFNGGNGDAGSTGGVGGGGGGAGSAGQPAALGGNGGIGIFSTITGANVGYAGGGGRGTSRNGTSKGIGAIEFGGANGSSTVENSSNGVIYTGGGGGGGSEDIWGGGAGGSGTVIIRYPDTFAELQQVGGSPTYTVVDGYRIYQYTSSGYFYLDSPPTIEIVNVSLGSTTSGSSVTVSKPANVQVGDLMIFAGSSGNASSNRAWTQLTGWTEIVDNGGMINLGVQHRRVDGTEGASFTFTGTFSGDSIAGYLAVFRNAKIDDVGSPREEIGNGYQFVATPEVTAIASNSIVLAIYGKDTGTPGESISIPFFPFFQFVPDFVGPDGFQTLFDSGYDADSYDAAGVNGSGIAHWTSMYYKVMDPGSTGTLYAYRAGGYSNTASVALVLSPG
jgi:hypothetical protein